MPRQIKQQPAQPALADENVNHEALAAAGDALSARTQQLVAVDKRFGDVVEYERDRVINEAKFFVNQASESFLEAGKRLILLKEHEEHGDFLKALERIGIADSTARKLMKVAALFADSKHLSTLPRSKLLELSVLDDEQIAELDAGGTVLDMKIDDVDRMGVLELRANLRKERASHAEDNEANERLIANKDKKINQLTRKSSTPWDERMGAVVNELHESSLVASAALTTVFQVAQACAKARLENDEEMHQATELAVRVINDVNLLVQRVAAIQGFTYENFLQYVDTGATPQMIDPISAKAKKG